MSSFRTAKAYSKSRQLSTHMVLLQSPTPRRLSCSSSCFLLMGCKYPAKAKSDSKYSTQRIERRERKRVNQISVSRTGLAMPPAVLLPFVTAPPKPTFWWVSPYMSYYCSRAGVHPPFLDGLKGGSTSALRLS